jgi:cytochrome c biogenesis protein CcmG, thiol:disulfide interchange protein DsbE
VPKLKELHERYKGQGLVLIAVHSDPDAEKMREAAKSLEMPWLVAQDGERKTMRAYHADSFPDYYLIDRSGKVRFADLANAEVERAVQLLIEEKPPN